MRCFLPAFTGNAIHCVSADADFEGGEARLALSFIRQKVEGLIEVSSNFLSLVHTFGNALQCVGIDVRFLIS